MQFNFLIFTKIFIYYKSVFKIILGKLDYYIMKKIILMFLISLVQFLSCQKFDNLIEIKGVGNWTIHMFLMFSYGSSNIFPTGDLGFLKAISKLYKVQLPISERKLKLLYKKWSPYSSQATWYLWRSLDPIPVNY